MRGEYLKVSIFNLAIRPFCFYLTWITKPLPHFRWRVGVKGGLHDPNQTIQQSDCVSISGRDYKIQIKPFYFDQGCDFAFSRSQSADLGRSFGTTDSWNFLRGVGRKPHFYGQLISVSYLAKHQNHKKHRKEKTEQSHKKI